MGPYEVLPRHRVDGLELEVARVAVRPDAEGPVQPLQVVEVEVLMCVYIYI